VVKRPKARIGDVFQIPLHPGQVGHGQVVAVNSGPGPLYVVIFRRAWPLDAQPDIRNIVADEIAPSLKFATAQITKNDFRGGDSERSSGGGGGGGGRPVSNEPAYDPDEEPF